MLRFTGAVIEVTLDSQANVKLLDQLNFGRYRAGQSHHYYSGLAQVSPVSLAVPHAGPWNVVVDLGGYAGAVRASARLIA
jgi:hypothetical protein